MATFVLVHGAWHGGWCWQRVTSLLRAAGHEVYTPTLTGLGERAHLLSSDVGLDTHVEDVRGALKYEDLRDVILVGHSYGGVVITGVAGVAAERIGRLVYLDAFIPVHGQSLLDLLPPDRRSMFESQFVDGWRIPPQPLERFGVTDEADYAWARPKLGDQPLKTFTQPVHDPGDAAPRLPRTYIWAAAYPGFAVFAERTRADPAWHYREIATGHDAMITKPREVADLLLETAAATAPASL
jgi:pimeloyl-ACP methyl ester carboxylesterase